MFLLMTVSSAPMDLMHKRLASKSVTEMMSQPLSLALFQNKTFLSELAKADPDTLNTIIGLLNDLLDASIAASIAFTTDVNTALTERNAMTTLLAQATTSQTNANNAKTAADSAFTQATSDFNFAVNHHTAMVDELNDKQPGVNEESETLRSILVLVRTLLPITSAPTTAAPTTSPTTTASGCDEDLFSHANQNGHDLYCFNATSYPSYVLQSNGLPCTSSCKTLDGVESAAMCHNLVKNGPDCGAVAFLFHEGNGRCWAKTGTPDPTATGADYYLGTIQSENCATA
jgi:hypothetical protein